MSSCFFKPAYRCKMCGKLFLGDAFHADSLHKQRIVVDSVKDKVYHLRNGGTGSTNLHTTHQCPTGDSGYAEFVGFREL